MSARRGPAERPTAAPGPTSWSGTSQEPRITSSANPRVKDAVRLRERRHRDQLGLTLVDGARELLRALAGGAEIAELFVAEELLRSDDALAVHAAARAAGVPICGVSATVLEKLAFGDRSEGVVGVVRTRELPLDGLVLPANPLLAVVEGIEKPGNLGAILRSADGAGLDALIAVDPLTDVFNPNAIRASLGTIFAVPLATGSTVDVLAWLASRGIRPVVARVDAARLHTDVDFTGPCAIVLGSEATGLSAAWSGPGVEGVRLPMLGIADSLNVSVAAAILFYEARRQRGIPGPD